MLNVLTALPSEARPIIDHFKLSPNPLLVPVRAMSLYSRDDIRLLVTGIGKPAMAAGVGYLAALNHGIKNCAWLNIGIAGHADLEIGACRLVHRIKDADDEATYFPSINFAAPCPTSELITVSKPERAYSTGSLFDMEGSAFFGISQRFSKIELIQILKVVSDNLQTPLEGINRQWVIDLIQQNLTVIEQIVTALAQLSDQIDSANLELEQAFCADLYDRCRFTVAQQHLTADLVSRWLLLCPKEDMLSLLEKTASAKEVITRLETHLAHQQLELHSKIK